jgi:hypothetical protein
MTSNASHRRRGGKAGVAVAFARKSRASATKSSSGNMNIARGVVDRADKTVESFRDVKRPFLPPS